MHPRGHTGRDVSFLDGAGEGGASSQAGTAEMSLVIVCGGECGVFGAPAGGLGAGIDDGSEW